MRLWEYISKKGNNFFFTEKKLPKKEILMDYIIRPWELISKKGNIFYFHQKKITKKGNFMDSSQRKYFQKKKFWWIM